MEQPVEDLLRKAHELRKAGDPVQAEQVYARAGELARTTGDAPALAHALRHVSDLARERGAAVEALAGAGEAAALYRAMEKANPLDLANALRVEALALEALGRRQEALPVWRQAQGLYELAQVPIAVAECERRMGG
jgi:tetratricopeptide (TPR) repeat protein